MSQQVITWNSYYSDINSLQGLGKELERRRIALKL